MSRGPVFAGENAMGVASPPAGAAPPPVISGHWEMVFHVSVPTSFTFVSRLARPPAIQERTCSAETGPYSLPSPPMIVYIAIVQQERAGASTARAPVWYRL